MQITRITQAAYCMDGGSIYLEASDSHGQTHTINLVQHTIPGNASEDELFGRLYLNRELIEIRSDDEKRLLDDLRNAQVVDQAGEDSGEPAQQVSATRIVLGEDIKDYFDSVKEGPHAATIKLIRDLIQWVESPDYEALSKAR